MSRLNSHPATTKKRTCPFGEKNDFYRMLVCPDPVRITTVGFCAPLCPNFLVVAVAVVNDHGQNYLIQAR